MTDLSSLPLRAALRGQSPYGAPQLDVPHMLNTNENTHPVPRVVAEAVATRVAEVAGGLNRYPDREFTELRGSLAGYLGHGLTAEHMWAANGSNEVLQQILQAFGGPGRRLLTFLPSYSMYPLLAAGTDTTFVDGGRAADYTLSAEHAAADYLARGLGGVLRLRGKRPVTHGGPGHLDAALWSATDLDALAGWRGGLGLIPAAGLLVLDVDVKHGAPGPDTVAAWTAEAGPLPTTLTCRTPSGGWHLWYRYEGPHPRGGAGVDMRTRGHGYVAVPPSPGYEWTGPAEPAALPSAWADLLAARAARGRPRGRGPARGGAHETPADRAAWNATQDAAVAAAYAHEAARR